MSAALEFQNISKIYRSFTGRSQSALEDFSLIVPRGEIFGFLGPNGAGKTTAIHIALGFMRPTSGHGLLLDQPFGHTNTRRRVGFLAENVALYYRSARDLLRFYGALNGMRDPELSRRVRECLQEVGLEAEAARNVAKFSRGMLQRIGLAQAFINDPELLVFDEPTSALDPVSRLNVRRLLLAARDAGKTVFLSSHLLSEVEQVCDRIAILHKGRVVREGRTEALLESHEQCEIAVRNIERQNLPPEVQTIAERNGSLVFIVPMATQRKTIEAIWNAGGELISVLPVRKSLEELFVSLTSEREEAGAKP